MPQSRGGPTEGGAPAAPPAPAPPKKAAGEGAGSAAGPPPTQPLTVPEALNTYRYELSCDEYREVWNYSKIYFFKPSSVPRPLVDGKTKYDDADGAYLHSLNEHIAYRCV